MEEHQGSDMNGTFNIEQEQQVIQNLDNFHLNGNEEHQDETVGQDGENENYLPASELLKTDDPAQWDILLGHGGVNTANSKWERESLYQKFDPLVYRTENLEFTVPAAAVNPRIQAVKEEITDSESPVLISLTPPQAALNGKHARPVSPGHPIKEEPVHDTVKTEQPDEQNSPPDRGHLSIPHNEEGQLGTETPNYSDGTYSVHSSDAETDHSECPNDEGLPAEATFIKPSNIRVPKAAKPQSQRSSEDQIANEYDGKEFVSELQAVNQQISNENFINTDFSSALTNVEWDLLVDRGTGTCSAATKWERESLAQRFDPLVSLREQQERRAQNVAVVQELGRTTEESSCDGVIHFSTAESQLISIDTPPQSKFRGKMTIHSEIGDCEDAEAINDFAEPCQAYSGDESFTEEALSSDDLEIRKLKQQLEIQARNFQEQMNLRSLKLKEIEEAITSASKKLDASQQSNRVLREYEKSIVTLEGDIDRLKKQISKVETERKKIIEERDLAADDLRQAELAFSDLHTKYERVKILIGNFKRNEDILVNRYDLMKVKLQNRDAQLKRLNDTCEDAMNRMKNDYESRIKSEDLEGNRLRAQIRKLDLRLGTIEKDLEQKAKENAQLSHLCDDLIKGQRN